MASIPKDVVLIWTGTNASIPSGWTRETTLDEKFIKGAPNATDPNQTGGASTHNHTSSGHSHSVVGHTHTGTTTTPADGSTSKDTSGASNTTTSDHTHTFTSGSTTGSSSDTGTLTWSSVSTLPAYYNVIFIKSNIGILTNGIVALWGGYKGDSNIPTGWNECDGSGGRPDLRNKYLRGAGTGADAGGTGGSNIHTHSLSHNHSISHSHSGKTDINNNANHRGLTGDGANDATANHDHLFTLSTVNETSDTNNATSDSQSNEPPYKKLCSIMFGAGAIKVKGLIALWLGTLSNIPKGWVLCDGQNGTPDMRDKFMKVAGGNGEIGSIGGSSTHSHGAVSHTHSATVTHSHTGSTGYNNTWGYFQGNGSLYGIRTHYHNIPSTSSNTTTLSSANIPATSSNNNEPPYRTVAYIQFQKATTSPMAFLFDRFAE